jgi:hypothetical protein
LPRFVNDYGYRGFKWRLQGTVRMETPVLYFYSSQPVDARVKVSFPHGLITEWYPRAENEIFQKSKLDGSMQRLATSADRIEPPILNVLDTSLRTTTGAIEWPNVKVQPNSSPSFPVEPGPDRYYAARATDSAPLTVGDQHEKFLFYRGVGRFPVPLSARIFSNTKTAGDAKIVVENPSHETVPLVILFENRGGHLGFRNAGPLKDNVTLDAPPLTSTFAALRQDLEASLIAQGLFPKEAQAMVETWRDSWFEEGERLIYIVPSSAVDSILPLQVEPAPARTARVFVGRIELLTPETEHAVESALLAKDWASVETYNRFLLPILQRVYAAKPANRSELERSAQEFASSCR